MGCRPQWDEGTARVTGIEVLPPAAIGRPRVDVTLRISGLFRDMFPTQIALIDAAVAAVAARDESPAENPLAAAGPHPRRVFGSRPAPTAAGRRSGCRAAPGRTTPSSAAPTWRRARTRSAAPTARAWPWPAPSPSR